MRRETREYLSSLLVERASYAKAIKSRWASREWERYNEFRKLLRTYDNLIFLVRKLPVVTFGIGLLLGLWLGERF